MQWNQLTMAAFCDENLLIRLKILKFYSSTKEISITRNLYSHNNRPTSKKKKEEEIKFTRRIFFNF